MNFNPKMMMKRIPKYPQVSLNKFFAFFLVGVLFMLTACSDDKVDKVSPDETEIASGDYTDDVKKFLADHPNMTKIGKKLEDPYTLDNMRNALDELIRLSKEARQKDSNAPLIDKTTVTIEPTDYYVRFLPKDSVEFRLIKKDTLLHFYSYPLDHEIVHQGNNGYRDPSLPLDQITWQYTVVDTDYDFPDVKYEIIKELFIPQHSPDYIAKDKITDPSDNDVLETLETASLYLTDNLPKEQVEEINKLRRQKTTNTHNARMGKRYRVCWWFYCYSEYRPHGNIRTWDDTETKESYVPVKGVSVSCRKWYLTHSGITNSNGYFECDGTFRWPGRYRVEWERYQFEVKDSWGYFGGVARYNGPKKLSEWNLYIRGGRQQYYSHIFRAAYHYYYQNRKGLSRPKLNCWYCNKLSIDANIGSGISNHFDTAKFAGMAEVDIYAYGRSSSGVYATTIHELAHAAHSDNYSDDYDVLVFNSYIVPFIDTYTFDPVESPARRALESWATGVETILTRMVYPDYDVNEDKDDYYKQSDYTEIVVELVEQGGFSIRQIERTLEGTVDMSSWRRNMIKRYGRYSYKKNIINAIFDKY